MELLNSLNKDDTKKENTIIDKMIDIDEPDEFIIEIHETSEIQKKEIKKVKKPFDTLYLRQKDYESLISVLDAYNNGTDVFEQFGIPKKLGLLLHGLPGTGKTSTILAVANYLNVDIFYLDLNGITKNHELKEMFDYVQKENINGGIIVFEDIDAMTNIVYKRDDEELSRLADLKEEDDLSLSFLLNMLDGTLCADDTIFAITTNHKEKLDPAIFRKGRIDVDIEFKKCDKYQAERIFEKFMNRKLSVDVLERFKEDAFVPADIIFHVYSYYYRKHTADEEIMKPFIV